MTLSAIALLVLTYPGHASAQQAASPDKAGQSQQDAEASFMAENQAAMSKMMKNMAVKPTGNIDADFTAMMIAHHQGAVDMAEAELRYGHNKKLLRIAKSIIAVQRQQIGAMKAALGQPLPAPTSSATQSGALLATMPGPHVTRHAQTRQSLFVPRSHLIEGRASCICWTGIHIGSSWSPRSASSASSTPISSRATSL